MSEGRLLTAARSSAGGAPHAGGASAVNAMAALSSPAPLRVLTKKSLIGLSFCSCWYVPHSALKDFHAAAMDRDIANTPESGASKSRRRRGPASFPGLVL